MATYWENSCSFGLRYVSWYKYLIVSLVFSHLGFWSGNLFLIAPFPDLCLLVPFFEDMQSMIYCFHDMFTYDKTFDPEVFLGHCDLISWFSDFALYLDTQLVFFLTSFRL